MKHKVYLNTFVFRVVSPEQPGGDRDCQLLNINNIAITYAAIMGNFDQMVVRQLMGNGGNLHNFVQWNALMHAINNFLNDVELRFPLSPPTTVGYEPDSDDSSSLEDLEFQKFEDVDMRSAPTRPNSRMG